MPSKWILILFISCAFSPLRLLVPLCFVSFIFLYHSLLFLHFLFSLIYLIWQLICILFPSPHHLYPAHSSLLSCSPCILWRIDRLMMHSKQKQAAPRHPALRLMNCFRDSCEINHSHPGQEQRQRAGVGGYIQLVVGEANTGTIIQYPYNRQGGGQKPTTETNAE